MAVIIHFFRLRSKPRIDYEKLIYYFDDLAHCKTFVNDDFVEMVCTDPVFDFPYRFLITKRSRVESIYNLSSNYTNINFLCEIPSLLPEFVSRGILKFIMELCLLFELEVYYNGVKDIESFDMAKLISYLAFERTAFLESHDVKRHYLKREILNQICNYQQMLPFLPEKLKGEALVHPYHVLVDKNGEVALSIVWKQGTPMVFPPHLDYIHVEEEDQPTTVLPASAFFRLIDKFMYELKDYMPNMRLLLLQGRGVGKARKAVRKLRKESLPANAFSVIRIVDLLET